MFNKAKFLNDRILAMDLLAGSIGAANALCAASAAADNPDLKRLYKEFLQDTLMGADTLETYTVDHGWIKPFASPDEQLQIALEHSDEVVAVPV